VVAVTGAVNAVTGAVTAVTWGRDPALDVTGTVPAVIAVAGCHSPSRRADGPGHVLLATLGSLAHATLACATQVATALRDTRRYAGIKPVRETDAALHFSRSASCTKVEVHGPACCMGWAGMLPRCMGRHAAVCFSDCNHGPESSAH
jgi:hypothetical protein